MSRINAHYFCCIPDLAHVPEADPSTSSELPKVFESDMEFLVVHSVTNRPELWRHSSVFRLFGLGIPDP